MPSVNKVFILGALGKDPALNHTKGNTPVCSLSVATDNRFKGKDGQYQSSVEWHRVTAWGDLAANCAKYLTKGRYVHVEGHLQSRKWENKEGQTVYSLDIVAEKITFLPGKDEQLSVSDETPAAPAATKHTTRSAVDEVEDWDD
jgi:single-strand DNA-binding protein